MCSRMFQSIYAQDLGVSGNVTAAELINLTLEGP